MRNAGFVCSQSIVINQSCIIFHLYCCFKIALLLLLVVVVVVVLLLLLLSTTTTTTNRGLKMAILEFSAFRVKKPRNYNL